MSSVSVLPGVRLPSKEPVPALCAALGELLEMARSGELQSFVGTGFTADGLRAAVWFDSHPDVYQMLGALSWLQHEYVDRHTGGVDG